MLWGLVFKWKISQKNLFILEGSQTSFSNAIFVKLFGNLMERVTPQHHSKVIFFWTGDENPDKALILLFQSSIFYKSPDKLTMSYMKALPYALLHPIIIWEMQETWWKDATKRL